MAHSFLTDLRQALRGVMRRPRPALLAAGGYAVGIGVLTALFGVVDDVLLDPLPWPTAERVVGIWERNPRLDAERVPAAPAKIEAWRAEADVFDAVRAWRLDDMDLTGRGDPERIPVARLEPGLLSLLGVEPLLGRAFAPGEAVREGDGVALLTWHAWSERFGADPSVLGRTLTLEGRPHEVVGVLPRGAHFPEGAEVVVPLVIDEPASRSAHAFRVLARLGPGIDHAHAQARLDRVAGRLEAAWPETDRGWSAVAVPLRDQLVGDIGPVLLLLLGAGALVFLVTCANGAGLLLVRAAARRRELALRRSLGASRARILWLLAAESLLLALAGGATGLLLARWASAALLAAAPAELPAPVTGGFDATVLLFATASALAAGLVFGLLPALGAARAEPMDALRAPTGGPQRRRGVRVRDAVVVAEIALAVVLVVGSGLLVRSSVALARVDPGFDVRGLLVADVEPSRDRYPGGSDRRQLYRAVLDEVASLPGVEGAALVNSMPLAGRTDAFRYQVEGRAVPTFADLDVAAMRTASPGYFRLVGIDMVAGRGFTPADRADAEPVAVVSRTLAREQWPDGDAVGARISLEGDAGPWIRVVGVADDVRHAGLHREATAEIYRPMEQEPWPSASVVARAGSDPLALAPALRAAVGRADPLLPVLRLRTAESLVHRAGARWRFQAVLVALFAAVAVTLAVTGVYGLLAWVVHERTGELAVRRALGARAADLRRLVTGRAATLAAVGVTLGLAVAWSGSGFVRGMLYGTGTADPVSWIGGALLVTGAALAAAWIPARRAARTDPAGPLRAA